MLISLRGFGCWGVWEPFMDRQAELLNTVSYLDTSGFWPRHNKMAWALRSRPQQGRQNSSKMMVPRWRITPTRSRFLPPNVCTPHNGHFLTRRDDKQFERSVSWYQKSFPNLRHQSIACQCQTVTSSCSGDINGLEGIRNKHSIVYPYDFTSTYLGLSEDVKILRRWVHSFSISFSFVKLHLLLSSLRAQFCGGMKMTTYSRS